MRSASKILVFIASAVLLITGCSGGREVSLIGTILATPTPTVNSPGLPTYLKLDDISLISKVLDCDERYPLASDYQRVSPMRGVYCVTGLRENYRVVRVYESSAAAKQVLDQYLPYQTGGRKVYLMGNWFIYGLPSDFKAVESLRLRGASDPSSYQRVYPERQNICKGLISEALRGRFSGSNLEKVNLESAERLFKGSRKQLDIATSKYGLDLKSAFAANNGLLAEQRLSEASRSYQNFCLNQPAR